MSQKNVEIVRAAIEAFNRRDLDAALTSAAPHFEYDLSRATGPFRGVYSLDQVRGVLEDLVGIWESSRIEPHEFIEAGEQVVVPWTSSVTGRDGIEVQARTTWTFTIRDGAFERLCLHVSGQARSARSRRIPRCGTRRARCRLALVPILG